ncbi:MAG TPA: winged helix DNA-binding domain-containing protein [Candidatus Limnocylindria bacterium]
MPVRVASQHPVLSDRALNRALLARQMLLDRAPIGPVAAIERLACLQAQWAPSPYVALWSRLARFARDDLTRRIDQGEVLKATLMRATLHLVSAREYPAYSLATLEGRFAAWRPPGAPALAELAKIHARVRRFAATTPRTRAEIREHVASHLPPGAGEDERLRSWLVFAAVATSGLIWEPASARWEHRTLARFVAPPPALRKAPRPEAAYELVVRRHLAAFGPAAVADVAAWSSARVPPIRAALARMGDLVRFTDARGRELFDLADAPRPSADVDAQPRFLARFDAAILGHAAPERVRILPEPYRKSVIHAAEVEPTFLVDGMVAGSWRARSAAREAIVELRPFKPLLKAVRLALTDEGERLARFIAPESARHGVKLA